MQIICTVGQHIVISSRPKSTGSTTAALQTFPMKPYRWFSSLGQVSQTEHLGGGNWRKFFTGHPTSSVDAVKGTRSILSSQGKSPTGLILPWSINRLPRPCILFCRLRDMSALNNINLLLLPETE